MTESRRGSLAQEGFSMRPWADNLPFQLKVPDLSVPTQEYTNSCWELVG